MTACRLCVALLVFSGAALCQGISESDILTMFRAGTAQSEIVGQIQSRGLSFEMDSASLERLGEAGVPRLVLDAAVNAHLNTGADPDDLIRRGRLDTAAAVLTNILRSHPKEHLARYKLILIYIKQDRPVEAAAEYQELKRMQDDDAAKKMVREIEGVLPEVAADPETELQLRADLRKALEQYHTAEAYAIVDRMQIGARSRDILKAYLDMYQADFVGAYQRALAVGAGGSEEDRKAGKSLRTDIERASKQYQEITHNLNAYRYSQLAIGSSTPVTARTAVAANHFSIQAYVQAVIDGSRAFPLSAGMQDLRFHAVLISSPQYEDVVRVGDEVLNAQGSLRIPCYSRDAVYWLVLDRQHGRIYTQLDAKMPRNVFGSSDLGILEEFDMPFRAVKAIKQKITPDHALYGIAEGSYVLRFAPHGQAPNYTFMNLIHCLYGEQIQKTVARNLGDFVMHVIGNPKVETALVNPDTKSRDWIMTGAQPLAYAAATIAAAVPVVVAVHPVKLPPGQTNTNSNTNSTLNTMNMSAEVIQNSLNVLTAHAVELVRISEIQGRTEDERSMFGMLRTRAFPLIDPAVPPDRIKRVDNLLALAAP